MLIAPFAKPGSRFMPSISGSYAVKSNAAKTA